jgi:5,10-methylenetetrahydrofolate reductase
MTLRSDSSLERLLHQGVFGVTSEVVPPRSGDPEKVMEQARGLVGYADAVNVTDNPTSSAHMSAVAGAALVASAGLEPVVQLTCRDRNRLGLTSDLLGAWALGTRNVLCLTGDPPKVGDHPEAKAVYDLDVLDLIRLAAQLRDRGQLLSGAIIEEPPRYFIGVADVPLDPSYDFARLDGKAEAGADFVQTQIVFDVEAFEAWAEGARVRGIFERMFVLAGVAVAGSARTARYIREHLPGVVVPDGVVSRLEEAGPDAQAEGVRLTVEVVARLKAIQGIAGIHVMGLGRMDPVRHVIEGAGLTPRPAPTSGDEAGRNSET